MPLFHDPDALPTLSLLLCPQNGNTAVLRVQLAARYLGISLSEVLTMPLSRLCAALPPGLSAVAEAVKRCGERERELAQTQQYRLEAIHASMITPAHTAYPETLRQAPQGIRPVLLTLRGNPRLLTQPGAAIVGARAASQNGLQIAADCAKTFAVNNIPVISGGAQGVDMAAHTAALETGGETVVVLPQGVLTFHTPPAIACALKDQRALLVSQFLPSAHWETHAAVSRNATIARLSRLVCCIEPRKNGGSLQTARHAMAQGKPILIHFAEDAPEVLPALSWQHASAGTVLDPTGQFSPSYLLNAWQTAHIPARETFLFDSSSEDPR